MSNFDVFINGIQPDHKAKAPQIIVSFSEKLKITSQKAEKILKTPNTRISQSVSQDQATKIQQSLNKMGVICVYRPSAGTTGLSLEPIETTEEGTLTACPNCSEKFPDPNIMPEKCNSCGVYLEKFIRINSEENEKEKIRRDLMRRNSIQNAREQKNKDEQAAKIRKKILEQEVLNENPSLKKSKKTSKQTYAILGGSLLIATVAGGSYLFSDQKDNSPAEIISATSTETKSLQDTDDLSTEIPQSSGNVGTSQNAQGSSNTSDSQKAMQKTHDQAQKVLNAFGLDADAMTNSSGSGSNANASNIAVSPSTLNTTQLTSSKASSQSSKNQSINPSKFILTSFLSDFGNDKQEENHYLAKITAQSIANNKLNTAKKVLPYLKETNKFIDLSGKLSNKIDDPKLVAKINSNIETRIKSSPLNMQAHYFSQAAVHHNNQETSGFLFYRAEKLWRSISNPHQQLSSALKIAVSYFKKGNSESANHFFSKIKPLLSKITTKQEQISSRTAISRAFQDVGQNKMASNWLTSTDKFVKNSNKSSIQDIVNGYAYTNQPNKVETLVKQASPSIQNELLYNAVRTSLDSGLNQNAVKLISLIQNPTHKALAYTLLASYIEDNSSYLSAAEALLNKSITIAGEKAIISSRIAQQYARQKNNTRINELFKQTEQLVDTIAASPEKDRLLEIVITNYADSLKQKPAITFSSYIQSPAVRNKIEEKMTRFTKISSLLGK